MNTLPAADHEPDRENAMSLNSILLFTTAESATVERGPAAYAVALAAAHGASLTVLAVNLDVTTPGRQGDPDECAEAIGAAARRAGVETVLVTGHSRAMGIHEVVAEHARHHDLVILGCGGEGMITGAAMAEHLLFAGGRPMILVPEGFSGAAPRTFAVAWDNTPAAARALGDARPLIGELPLTFLTIGGDKQVQTDMPLEAVLAAAARRGLNARAASADKGDREIAEALQQESMALGADLLVMGGFAHSTLRRMVLGSATAGILAGPQMPVLLSH
jgi:nucleotide-binding universal stress UspA family protein